MAAKAKRPLTNAERKPAIAKGHMESIEGDKGRGLSMT
jgi:hypothetical protein